MSKYGRVWQDHRNTCFRAAEVSRALASAFESRDTEEITKAKKRVDNLYLTVLSLVKEMEETDD